MKHYEVLLKELNNQGRPFLNRWVEIKANTRKEAREIAQSMFASPTQRATIVKEKGVTNDE